MAKVKKIQIINGPNLHLQGIREPEIYGTKTFEDLLSRCHERFPDIEILLFQSNYEGELIEKIHQTNAEGIPIILNLAALTHTSYALADALAAVQVPVVEVHISNILGREEWRARSLTARYCCGVIIGFGLDGYLLAMEALTGYYNLHL
ncbi:MAG: 3-dehydroquinate dehydratase [Flavobacteriales bacterium]|nr:3-dehydroquinate dehydratase [Flavobacteriales bacterium]MCX7768186.1 3-dehydroquinate dehydratase [Flavobacteriales bacterium]